MKNNSGFTLIELSIVLVIIGLIIGGILLGRDLIKASEVNAQIAQITKYNSAVNAFRNKYGGLPGDLNIPLANQFGFTVGANCNGTQGFRDGDGIIGDWPSYPLVQGAGESAFFWQDLSAAQMIEGQFPALGSAAVTCTGGGAVVMSLTPGGTYVGNYMPAGKIGYGAFVYQYDYNSVNWFGLAAVTGNNTSGILSSSATISVIQAYNIDKKIDDGLPITGSVLATYVNNNNVVLQPVNAQATDSTTSCYNTTNNIYSISGSANQGSGLNCALSFKFE